MITTLACSRPRRVSLDPPLVPPRAEGQGASVAPAACPPSECAEPADAADAPEPAAAPHGRRARAAAAAARRPRPERVPKEGRGRRPEQASQASPREGGGRASPSDGWASDAEPSRRGGRAAEVAAAPEGPERVRAPPVRLVLFRRRRRPRAEREVRTRRLERGRSERRRSQRVSVRDAFRRRRVRLRLEGAAVRFYARRAEPERMRLGVAAARRRRVALAGGDGGPRARVAVRDGDVFRSRRPHVRVSMRAYGVFRRRGRGHRFRGRARPPGRAGRTRRPRRRNRKRLRQRLRRRRAALLAFRERRDRLRVVRETARVPVVSVASYGPRPGRWSVTVSGRGKNVLERRVEKKASNVDRQKAFVALFEIRRPSRGRLRRFDASARSLRRSRRGRREPRETYPLLHMPLV